MAKLRGEPLHVISLGAGVQSTTMYLMALNGTITPKPKAAIFADTGFEPRAVYEHLEYLRSIESDIPIRVVSHGNIRDDTLAALDGKTRWAAMPLYVPGKDGSASILRRQCTREYKIQPIEREIRRMMGLRKGQHVKRPVTQWVGITTDEIQRLKEADKRWATFRYPLALELRMSRADCIRWLDDHGYPRPPKSSCICCPFHDNDFWSWLASEHPDDFEQACDFDDAIRQGLRGVKSEAAYLHRSLKPLRSLDFTRRQYVMTFPEGPEDVDPDGMVNECFGVCGV